jgi:BlaI family penicillinase repressor
MARISPSESKIMEALWQAGPQTLEAIVARVVEPCGWAPGTVKTLVTRLLKKVAIEGKRGADGYFYHPLITREDYVHSESETLVDRLFGGEVGPLVVHFAEHRALTPRDIALLRKLIQDLP